MGVCTDYDITCYGKSFFRQQGMLNSHLADLEIVRDLIAACEFAHAFAVFCRFDILVRYKVIRYQRDLVLIEHTVHLHFFHLFDGNRACNVVAQNQIQLRFNQLSCFHMIESGMRGQNLLCHCHSHMIRSPFWLKNSRICRCPSPRTSFFCI